MVNVNGLNMHIAEKGQGPIVLLLHGFPELWYSWRHQILALASLGYKVVAPDLRGFGDTDAPKNPSSYTSLHIVGDLIGLLDAIAGGDGDQVQEKVFMVGHDWGAIVAWYLCLHHPDRVSALVNMSVPFMPRNPKQKLLETFCAAYGDDYYMRRFQDNLSFPPFCPEWNADEEILLLEEPGVVEAEFAQIGTTTVLKELLTNHHPGPLYLPKGKWFQHTPIALSSWLTEEDVNYYTSKYEKKGFTGGLNYYRNLDLTWELNAPWTGAQVKVPVKFIIGEVDLTYSSPSTKEYKHKGGFKKDVPLLEEVIVMEGVAHFIKQERPDEIGQHIYDFISKF